MRLNTLVLIASVLTCAFSASAERVEIIHVDDDAPSGGDGSGNQPFDNLHSAVQCANASPARVRVIVRPGDYVLTTPLLIERSIELHGSTMLSFDSDGLPTGAALPGTETRIIASGLPGPASLLLAQRTDGGAIGEVHIRGASDEHETG